MTIRVSRTTMMGVVALVIVYGIASAASDQRIAGNVTASRVQGEIESGENWLVRGGRFTGDHYSPLAEIHVKNVDSLGFAWATEIPSGAGLISEPLVVDGVVYLSAPMSIVYALDATTGKQLWVYDPKVDPSVSVGSSLATRWNRGVAVWKGTVIVGTGDCRLVAIDAANGTKRWDVTACDAKYGLGHGGEGAGITAAPLVADDKVYIGYMGLGDVRGSLGAFDAASGKELWRFWTVPGDPDKGFENEALSRAAKTWGQGWAKAGGGEPWDAIHYDPETGFIIFGTASGMPLGPLERGPGDGLYANSIIAVDAATGTYQWHYQTVPADAWDYDATMPKIVTDVEIDGKKRRVVFESGKSGFFYVLDARTGDLLSADAIATVSWASHVDLETGRPVTLPDARYWEKDASEMPVEVFPNSFGARNWEPMAYNPRTKLLYMPVTDLPSFWCNVENYDACAGLDLLGNSDAREFPPDRGRLLAWDPIKREERWSSPHRLPFNGGVLTTAGDLVFQGTGTGDLHAYHAESGKRLWSRATGSSIQASPVTYRVGDDQYVLVTAGTGGGTRLIHPKQATLRDARGPARAIAFKLNGKADIPVDVTLPAPIPKPPKQTASAETIKLGSLVYGTCLLCHGAHAIAVPKHSDTHAIPDLRYSPFLHSEKGWNEVVMEGALSAKGMLPMNEHLGLTQEHSEAIRAYVIEQAWKAYGSEDNE